MKLSKDYPIIDVRGRGLMVAAEFGGEDGGMTATAGTASKVTKACAARNLLLLSAGAPAQCDQQDYVPRALLECQATAATSFLQPSLAWCIKPALHTGAGDSSG